MKIILNKNQSGFTLVEVLVTVAVTGILTVMATVIFINTVRNSKKAEVTSEGRQNAALVIDRLQKDARGATSLAVTGSAPTETLTITKNNGTDVSWQCVDPGGGGIKYITRDDNSGALTLTNRDPIDGINIEDCDFEQVSGTLVNFSFTVTETPSLQQAAQEYDVNLEFKTSVATRSD